MTRVAEQQRHASASESLKRLLAHRNGIRKELSAAMSRGFAELSFERFWDSLTDGLSNLFYRHGVSVVNGIRDLAAMGPAGSGDDDSKIVAESLYSICRKASYTLRGSGVGERLAARSYEAFRTPGTACNEWATHLCAVYVPCCCLGLDPQIQTQFANQIRGWRLLLDSHYMLSLLGVAEPDHVAMKGVVASWSQHGGTVMVTPPVAEEVRNHAKLAKEKFVDLYEARWATMPAHEAPTINSLLLDYQNVFLRSFLLNSRSEVSSAAWEEYIGQFFEGDDLDALGVLATLSADYGLSVAEEDLKHKSLATQISKSIVQKYRPTGTGSSRSDHQLRADWDGRLATVLLSERSKLKGFAGSATIVSTASDLRQTCVQYAHMLGVQTAVVDLSRISFALALLPNASMTLTSLKSLLFGHIFSGRVARQNELATQLASSPELRQYRIHGPTKLRREIERRLTQPLEQSGDEALPVRPAVIRRGRGCTPYTDPQGAKARTKRPPTL